MKIQELNTYIIKVPLKKSFKISNYTFKEASAVIVEAITDTGIYGYGESVSRISPETVKSIIDNIFKPLLIDQDPLRIDYHWNNMFNTMRNRGHDRGFFIEAISGVDIALWDLFGKNLNLPIYKLLGGQSRTDIRVYASSIFWDSPIEMAKEAKIIVDEGFNFIKVKVGQGVNKDYECLREIRSAIDSSISISIDANCAYDTIQALKLVKLIEDLDICWFEEPLKPDNIEGYKFLSSHINSQYLAAGESEFTIYGIKRLLENGLNIIQPDIVRAGGITNFLKIAHLSEAFHAYIAPHTGMSSVICMAAALQVSAAVSNFLIYEHMVTENPLTNLPELDFPKPMNGYIKISTEKPGLGINFERGIFKDYIVDQ